MKILEFKRWKILRKMICDNNRFMHFSSVNCTCDSLSARIYTNQNQASLSRCDYTVQSNSGMSPDSGRVKFSHCTDRLIKSFNSRFRFHSWNRKTPTLACRDIFRVVPHPRFYTTINGLTTIIAITEKRCGRGRTGCDARRE